MRETPFSLYVTNVLIGWGYGKSWAYSTKMVKVLLAVDFC